MSFLMRSLGRFWPLVLAVAVQGALLSAPSVALSDPPPPDLEQLFVSVNSPVGVAFNPSGLGYVTRPLCGNPRQVLRVTSTQGVSVLATLPSLTAEGDPVCYEHKIAVSPGPQNNAGAGQVGYPTLNGANFVSNEIYVTSPKTTSGTQVLAVLKIGLNLSALYNQHIVSYLAPTTFATFSSCDKNASTGIAFDEVGTFGFKLIVVCSNPVVDPGGKVYTVANDGTALQKGTISTSFPGPFERPVVAPAGGPFSGKLLIPAENAPISCEVEPCPPPGKVLSLAGSCDGLCSATAIANIPSAEAVAIKQATACNFGLFNLPTGATYFAAKSGATPGGNRIDFIPRGPFAGTSGNAFVISENAESGIGIWQLTAPFATPTAFSASATTHEDAAFVDCFVPTIVTIQITGRGTPQVAVTVSSNGRFDAGRIDFNNSKLIPFDPANPNATSNNAGVSPVPGSCTVIGQNDNSQGNNNNQGQGNVLQCTFTNNLPNGGTGHGVFKAPVVDPAGPGDGAEGGC